MRLNGFSLQVHPAEMLRDLTVTAFLILLAASVVVVALMIMFPLIDLAFTNKVKTAPNDAEPCTVTA